MQCIVVIKPVVPKIFGLLPLGKKQCPVRAASHVSDMSELFNMTSKRGLPSKLLIQMTAQAYVKNKINKNTNKYKCIQQDFVFSQASGMFLQMAMLVCQSEISQKPQHGFSLQLLVPRGWILRLWWTHDFSTSITMRLTLMVLIDIIWCIHVHLCDHW